ncbi:UDP-3-O-(3-hydroxymyristoyl)glucosamine N-acyltransferase [Fluoribacter gormanii]|uniref:UDP-3-O-acylglucosamine N-acyltransferase n=1 Tax=Fluoribacter gormanii TaxID=464 RepID=A0A377GNE1_9GAMM|nr:UDP-3-O-(3-hydroxymyristoyl)glucosamine N-acyltransferase [Fluoribacter gormanii]KTD04692.1 UDP-3-O-(R-3-hydroxymyristoyl)-glucosamine N-acyltransferase [Fluoribacter gormanii]MCW8445328.1 UDP-3-O-(3-hydroxymyristoyl)glucosamine N-acyltransferase [Fluoribacter gormanii]MCW8470533.1 UDP-3-O-(3-hydroxymyristoyl)glucosamine N-acyltransferase [Fluoribacter gormanii]SIR13111.1 UDP-3-O-[3-hydroxymyristoyl] glucosamine N-acyltransferase [Fluoribacter gormanii]STO26309.1 UDP-3-O-acylglucosamine N-a
MSYSLRDIANKIQGVVIGDDSIKISLLSPIDEIIPGSLVFADSNENVKLAEASQAAAILVNEQITVSQKPLIQVKHPFKAFITLMHHFNPPQKIIPGIHPTAVIGEGVQLGNEVFIGPYVVIEAGSVIGDHCILKSHIHIGREVTLGAHTTIHSHVTVYDSCQIGSRVTIHASTVIGSDGFGYTFVDGKHLKVPHIGRVIIEDDVEIGANTAIDRATMGATVIGEGTKIDNLVQVAHSVKLGKHNILCGFTGIAGSTTSGNHVIFAANVGVSDHVRIDDGVVLGARTGVPPNKHLKEGNVYLGNPARPKDLAIQHELGVNRIPLIRKNIKALSEQVESLKKQLAKAEAE